MFRPMRKIRKVMYPLLWYERTSIVDSASARKMRNLVVAQKQTLATVQWLLVGGGIFMMSAASGYGINKFVL